MNWNFTLNKDILILAGVLIFESIALTLFRTDMPIWASIPIYVLVGFGLARVIKKLGLGAGHAIYDFSGIILLTLIEIYFFKGEFNWMIGLGIAFGLVAVYLLHLGGSPGHNHFN
jgi:multidrug transporter EmrE-like cation transporter